MNVSQKEIVLINYPFSDLEGKKVRPAIIIPTIILMKNQMIVWQFL